MQQRIDFAKLCLLHMECVRRLQGTGPLMRMYTTKNAAACFYIPALPQHRTFTNLLSACPDLDGSRFWPAQHSYGKATAKPSACEFRLAGSVCTHGNGANFGNV